MNYASHLQFVFWQELPTRMLVRPLFLRRLKLTAIGELNVKVATFDRTFVQRRRFIVADFGSRDAGTLFEIRLKRRFSAGNDARSADRLGKPSSFLARSSGKCQSCKK